MTDTMQTIDRTMAALGDPTRVRIVDRLSAGPASVSELAAAFPLSLRGVLKHVEVLEHAGVVRTAKRGRTRQCELAGDHIGEAVRWMEQVRSRWERRLDRMEQYLTDDEETTR